MKVEDILSLFHTILYVMMLLDLLSLFQIKVLDIWYYLDPNMPPMKLSSRLIVLFLLAFIWFISNCTYKLDKGMWIWQKEK
jgi:phosphoglycerol transferase MdoB-like AlkP superfamily enzyme